MRTRAVSSTLGGRPPRGAGQGIGSEMAAAVLERAEATGLLRDKDSRITGRVSALLITEAKRRTGIAEDTRLIEFALASLALEDRFVEAFDRVKGAVDPDLELGF